MASPAGGGSPGRPQPDPSHVDSSSFPYLAALLARSTSTPSSPGTALEDRIDNEDASTRLCRSTSQAQLLASTSMGSSSSALQQSLSILQAQLESVAGSSKGEGDSEEDWAVKTLVRRKRGSSLVSREVVGGGSDVDAMRLWAKGKGRRASLNETSGSSWEPPSSALSTPRRTSLDVPSTSAFPLPPPSLIFDAPLSLGVPPFSSTLATIPSSPLASPYPSILFGPASPLDPSFVPLSPSKSWSSPTIYSRPDISSLAPDLGILATAPIDLPPAALRRTSDILVPALTAGVHFSGPQEGAKEERRYHALVELVETETGYLESLRVLVKVYFATLPFFSTSSTPAEITAVVRNAEALLELHERIAGRLEQVEIELGWRGTGREAGSSTQDEKVLLAASQVASVLVDELPNFSLYNEFCARHGEALDVIRSIEARPEWESFERQCASTIASRRYLTSVPPPPLSLVSVLPTPRTPSPTVPSPTVPSPSASSSTLSSPPTPLPSPPPTALPSTIHPSPTPPPPSKLRFQDYAIKPVQRICRYPLVLGQVLKNLGDCPERGEVKKAWEGLRKVAEGVDEAKRVREGELRTTIVASRMEFQSPVNWAFCDVLGPTLLIGTLHVLHRYHSPDPLKVRYLGCFLYRSHLGMVKVKKRDSYEPREWLPLRLFELSSIEEGEGALPHSIRLSYRDHHFEVGACGPAEKAVWLSRLTSTQAEARRLWAEQSFDDKGSPTLFDETVVSSVPPFPLAFAPPPAFATTTLPRRKHGRSNSTPTLSVNTSSSIPAFNDCITTPFDSTPTSPVTASFSPLAATPSTLSRNRFSTTASLLLGRTPAAQRAAIDLRLADVFSEECLAARAQGRSRVPARPARTRTLSATKNALLPSGAKRDAAKEKRRMTYDEGMKAKAEQELHFDFGPGEGVDRRWTMGSKKMSGRAKHDLPPINVAAAGATTKLKSRTMSLRRAASHSSIDARPSPAPLPTPSSSNAEVERNNSVSSTISSSGTTNSSSSHGLVAETPPSSIPPSPDGGTIDFEHLRSSLPTSNVHPPRWGPHAIADGVSNVFLKRRNSRLSMRSGAKTPPAESQLEVDYLATGSGGATPREGLQRRTSTLGGFFSKRVQSSPTLSSLFQASNSGPSSTSHRAKPPPGSLSSPHLPIPSSSPSSTYSTSTSLPSSSSSSTSPSPEPVPHLALVDAPPPPSRKSMRFKFAFTPLGTS